MHRFHHAYGPYIRTWGGFITFYNHAKIIILYPPQLHPQVGFLSPKHHHEISNEITISIHFWWGYAGYAPHFPFKMPQKSGPGRCVCCGCCGCFVLWSFSRRGCHGISMGFWWNLTINLLDGDFYVLFLNYQQYGLLGWWVDQWWVDPQEYCQEAFGVAHFSQITDNLARIMISHVRQSCREPVRTTSEMSIHILTNINHILTIY